MEVRVDLDEELVDELDEEATLQGFEDREAYLRWIIAHRPMSELASTQAPAVASRVSELEERVKILERQLELDDPVDPDADLASESSGGTLDDAGAATESIEPDDASGGASLDEVDTSTESMDLAEPEDAGGSGDDETAAGDDDIAEAIGDVEIDDEEEAGDETDESDAADDDWE